jgi:hypothetical protein
MMLNKDQNKINEKKMMLNKDQKKINEKKRGGGLD